MNAPAPRASYDVVRALLAPLLVGRLPDGWRLLGWDAEQGISLTLEHRGRPILVELEAFDTARPCLLRTARFNLCARRIFESGDAGEGAPLDDAERGFVERIGALLRASERRLPAGDRPTSARQSLVREVLVDRALVAEGARHYYFNPYAGCMIGCPFCYVADRADLSRSLEGLPPLPWGRWVDVKVNAPDVLRREVRALPPGLVRMSPILTDPYQGIERRYRITRQALEIFLEAGFTPVVLTRAARVVDDLALLARFPVAAVGLSIPTDDDRMRAAFEPGGDPIEERLEALRRCHAAGLRTFCAIQPMLPMDPERLVAAVAPWVRAVRIDRMHALDKHLPLYQAAGCVEASTPAFWAGTEAALRAGFGHAGVRVDDLDDLSSLVGDLAAG
jgi:DNA repair photolyase